MVAAKQPPSSRLTRSIIYWASLKPTPNAGSKAARVHDQAENEDHPRDRARQEQERRGSRAGSGEQHGRHHLEEPREHRRELAQPGHDAAGGSRGRAVEEAAVDVRPRVVRADDGGALHAGGDDDDHDDRDAAVGPRRGRGAAAGAGGTTGAAAAALSHPEPAAGAGGPGAVLPADGDLLLVEPLVNHYVDRHDDHHCATGQYPAGTDPDAESGTSGGKMSYGASRSPGNHLVSPDLAPLLSSLSLYFSFSHCSIRSSSPFRLSRPRDVSKLDIPTYILEPLEPYHRPHHVH